jgi:hypothetical protein
VNVAEVPKEDLAAAVPASRVLNKGARGVRAIAIVDGNHVSAPQGNCIVALYLPPQRVSVRFSHVYVPPLLAPSADGAFWRSSEPQL